MHIIHVTSELAQAAKAGGLGDVLYGLSKAQVKLGHQIEIIIPKYDITEWGHLKNLQPIERNLWVTVGSQRYNNTIWKAQLEDLSLIFIEPHHPHYYFSRGKIYGEPDDIDRFTYFSKVALEFLSEREKGPDILHLHDWPTAVIAPLYKGIYAKRGFRVGGVVLTIHNLQYQGKCAPYHLTQLGLDGSYYLHPDRMQDPHSPLLINLIKGGIIYSDGLTTVSPTFVSEIRSPLGGFGLHETIQSQEKKLRGLLNGIDETYWNPEIDPLIAAHYPTFPNLTNENFPKLLKGKEENKKALKTRCGLSKGNKCLAASITRMVSQKGPELIIDAIVRTLEKGGQFILLGSMPEGHLLEAFQTLKKKFSKEQLFVSFEYNEQLAHLIYAGADLFVIPSLFEPCGLTQMIGMRYGTLPVVRKTGGLADTVFDIDTSTLPKERRNGFSFDFPDREGVHWALDRALLCYETDTPKWQQLMKQAINQDFSWKHAAPQYLEVYEAALKTGQNFNSSSKELSECRPDSQSSTQPQNPKCTKLK